MKMIERRYTVRFLTPAFLGDAEQNGRWRTPPFKHLLREWWRVAYAAEKKFDVNVDAMRRDEGLLFGNAWLEKEFCQSQVRLRLDRWDRGTLESWQALASVNHPEVRVAVGSDLYLGYGPIALPSGRRQPTLKTNAAIQANESGAFSLAFPQPKAPLLEQALFLLHRYGTAGGRSRNGWGSLILEGADENSKTVLEHGSVPLRDWKECLKLDWPHAIGHDEMGPLVWQTSGADDWKAIMKVLAVIKIGLRTQFVFPHTPPPHRNPLPRHWLSYPITRHTTAAFDRNARLPNSLRFKVRTAAGGKFVGIVFHMPHLPPPAFKPDHGAILETWKKVHRLLDELCREVRERTYSTIGDAGRRGHLKAGLDSVRLKRISE